MQNVDICRIYRLLQYLLNIKYFVEMLLKALLNIRKIQYTHILCPELPSGQFNISKRKKKY